MTNTILKSFLAALTACTLCVQAEQVQAETGTTAQQLETLQQQIEALQQQLNTTTSVLPVPPLASDSGHLLEIGLSSLLAVGASSVDNDALTHLQAGGHDPNQNGFTVQNVELMISATVDPYLDAQANLIFLIDAEGETVVELEEAFFTSRSLPHGLQLKGGQYYTEFGRRNAQHPHSWAFVDQPVILSRLFGGDGLRSQGTRLSWLMPTDWYSELYVGLQNAKGETVSSFLSAAGEDIAGHTLLDRSSRNFGDLLYSARWLNALDLSDTTSLNLGISGLWGPNASGLTTDTRIYGLDLYLKWQALNSQRGYPFVAWHSELLERHYEAGDATDPSHENLNDQGWFTQLLWGYTSNWVAGLRLERAYAEGDTSTDPLRDTRKRLSPNLTWYITEYSKLRLQYNRDWAQHLNEDSADSLWLQFEFNMGRHMAHTF